MNIRLIDDFFYLRFLVFDYMFTRKTLLFPNSVEFFAKLNKKCKDAHYFMKPFLH